MIESEEPESLHHGGAQVCPRTMENNSLTMKNDRSTVGGMNDMTTTETRDIILDVTEKLIYRHGIAATGMELLVKTAGVSRKSIYRYFANKDELVIAALQRRDERWLQWLRSEVEQAPDSGARLLGVFSALKAWFASADFRGCAFINTSGETGDPQDPVRLLAKAHKQKLFEYLLELCNAHGTPAPEQQAAQLLILVDGAITMALIMGDETAADNAQCMAQLLLAL